MYLSRLHWLSIGMLIVSALLLGTASVTAQDTQPAPPSMDEQIMGDATHPSNIFGGTSEKPVVKDLYKSVYKSLKVNPGHVARVKTGEQFGYSESVITLILDGDLGVLFRTHPELPKSEDILALYDEITTAYQKAFAEEQLRQNLFLDTYPQEIFVNGETSDSGFDVVYDLDILELLLFGDQETTGGGGGQLPPFPEFPRNDVSGPPVAPSASGPAATTPPDSAPDSASTGPESSATDAVAPDSVDSSTDATPTTDAIPTIDSMPQEGDPLNPTVCAADSALQSAFQEVVPAPTETAPPQETNSAAPGAPENNASNEGNDASSNSAPSSSGRPHADSPYKSPFINDDGTVQSNLIPQVSSKWADTPNLCNKIFCLEIKFTNRPGSNYEKNTNCVQCHVQYIVNALRDTTSQSLSPGKVSGNLMEPATCKKTLFSGGVSLNFIPIAMPIKTPGASELVTGVDLSKNFENFLKTTWGTDFSKSANPDKVDGSKTKTTTGNALDEAIKYQTTISTPGTNQQTAFDAALANYDKHIEEIRQKFNDSYTAAQFNASADFYQSMRYEVDQMNFYFESFRAAIEMAQEVTEDRKNNLTPAS